MILSIKRTTARLVYFHINKKLYNYIESFLSFILCGFQKAHNTQHALLKLLHFWQKDLGQKGFVDTILKVSLQNYNTSKCII